MEENKYNYLIRYIVINTSMVIINASLVEVTDDKYVFHDGFIEMLGRDRDIAFKSISFNRNLNIFINKLE